MKSESKQAIQQIDIQQIEHETNVDYLDSFLPAYLNMVGTGESQRLLDCFDAIRADRGRQLRIAADRNRAA